RIKDDPDGFELVLPKDGNIEMKRGGNQIVSIRKVPRPESTDVKNLPKNPLKPTPALEQSSLLFEDDFERGADHWQPTDPAAWKIIRTGQGQHYSQFQMSKYKPPFRSPFNIALIKGLKVTDLVLQAKVLSTGKEDPLRDMCLFFGYQDPVHFYYV